MNDTITSLVPFTSTGDVVTIINKRGDRTTLRPQSAKEWKEANRATLLGLSNRVIKVKYQAYWQKMTMGAKLDGLGNDIIKGRFGCSKLVTCDDGKVIVTLLDKRKDEAEQVSVVKDTFDCLNAEQLKEVFNALEEKMKQSAAIESK
jgi:formylmethanofuran dehydrogenase subunit E